MLERVVIALRGATEHADLPCHWAGSVVTQHALIRPVRRFEQLEHFDDLLARIVALRQQDATAQDIADRLNAEGWKPPKRLAFNAPMIRRLLQRRGLGTRRPIWSGNVPRASEDEITIQELARRPPPDCLRLVAPGNSQGSPRPGRHPAHLAHQPRPSRIKNQQSRVLMTKRSRMPSPSSRPFSEKRPSGPSKASGPP